MRETRRVDAIEAVFSMSELAMARRDREALVIVGERPELFDEPRLAAIITPRATDHLDRIRDGIAEPLEDVPSDALRHLAEAKASLRVRRVHILDEALLELAFAAHRAFDEEVNINAYWSPPRIDMGLAPHADGYDIVVLQVAGAKDWTLWREDDSAESFRLEAGDALFLPRGLRHRATNPHPTASLHLAVGIYAKTTQSLVEWVATELASQATRELDAATTGEAIADLRARVEALLSSDSAAASFAAYREAAEYERMLMTPREHSCSDARRYR